MKTVSLVIKEKEHRCPVYLEEGLLQSELLLELCKERSSLILLTDSQVEELYAQDLVLFFEKRGLQLDLFVFPAGEKHKTRETKALLEEQLLQRGVGKDALLLALGGGVVTDLVGFLAATYHRGVPFISLPTTLMGMVDASIGGKTGVNTSYGKNSVGSFYLPEAILLDPLVLKTLPLCEWKNGLVEVIKHALLADPLLCAALEKFSWEKKEASFIEEMIEKSILIKHKILSEDFQEGGKRQLLNLGHTVGHALETLSHYTLSHGEAVAVGIVVESRLSYEMGFLSLSALERIVALCKHCEVFPSAIPAFTMQQILPIISRDKKARGGKPRFTLIKEIGRNQDEEYTALLEPSLLYKAFQWAIDALYFH